MEAKSVLLCNIMSVQ